MKRMAVFFLGFLLGLALIVLNRTAGDWLDRLFYQEELQLSQAQELLLQGELDRYETFLKNFILLENPSPKSRSLAFYNLGNSCLHRADRGDQTALRDALFYFKEALRNDPDLFPAKYNLELLIKLTKEAEKNRTEAPSEAPAQSEKDEGEEGNEEESGPTVRPPYLGPRP